MKDSSLFSYKNNYRENFVGFLQIEKGNRQNEISFDYFILPEDMPESMKKLIALIEGISKR